MPTIPATLELMAVGITPKEAEHKASGRPFVKIMVTPFTDINDLSEGLRDTKTQWPKWLDAESIVEAVDNLCIHRMGPDDRVFFDGKSDDGLHLPEGYTVYECLTRQGKFLSLHEDDDKQTLLGVWKSQVEACADAWDEAKGRCDITDDELIQATVPAYFVIQIPVPEDYSVDYQGSYQWTWANANGDAETDFASKEAALAGAWRNKLEIDDSQRETAPEEVGAVDLSKPEAKVQAIRALMNGIWDDPALRSLGPLMPSNEANIKAILEK